MTSIATTLILASRNRKKLGEMAALLAPHGLELIAAADLPGAPDVAEGGTSFAENAALKASLVAQAVGRWTVGDDSGLEVDALNGAPGVLSARYAGEAAKDGDNNDRLLRELEHVPDERRTARFVCHLAVADPAGQIRLQVCGSCRGRILGDHRGRGGFGYDPLFLIPEYHRTFGELSPAVKSVLSHRARAFQQLIPRLVTLLRSHG
ncbi:MAG: RdgB/HAM1 family non-canonical purine NTP pyrophosphatase [Planctomycetota bacterium]|nr:RdgB/HAM1 family non-canonical purine NTP pyrophosphatase [Planctomycetota bacterium]